MKRVDAPGFAPGNLFTNGNPSLNIPATTVDDSIMNAIQEEIVNVVLASGQTLDQTNVNLTQLLAAVQFIAASGGAQFNQTIVNNQNSPANITNMVLNSAAVKAAFIDFTIQRQSDTGGSDVVETGVLHAVYNDVAGTWAIKNTSMHDDAGVVFTITGAGQVQYVSTDIAGTNSTGEIIYTIRTMNVPTP